MLLFNCPNCQKRLKAPETRSGAELPCPSCGRPVIVPTVEATSISSPSLESCEQTAAVGLPPNNESQANPNIAAPENPSFPQIIESQHKQCPFCAETIQAAAMKCRFCGEFFEGRAPAKKLIQQTAPTIQSTVSQPTSILSGDGCGTISIILIACIFIVFPVLCLGILGRNSDSNSSRPKKQSSGSTVTCEEMFQVLVDDIDKDLKANVFGKVTCKGDHLYVVLEDDYFVRVEYRAKRLALESIRDEWVKSACYGKRVTFTRWDGSIVAEL